MAERVLDRHQTWVMEELTRWGYDERVLESIFDDIDNLVNAKKHLTYNQKLQLRYVLTSALLRLYKPSPRSYYFVSVELMYG